MDLIELYKFEKEQRLYESAFHSQVVLWLAILFVLGMSFTLSTLIWS
jgi:hypothetical protein